MKVLALDCSTSVGWAFFKAHGAAPMCGTWKAPSTWSIEDYGSRFAKFHDWLCDMLTTLEPNVLAFESPVLPRGSMDFPTTEHTLRTLIGLVSVAELVAKLRGVRCREVNVSTAKKALTGNGRAQKSDMIVAATNRGFGVADDHQADACAVGLVALADLRARAA
jgi:Holliday junction resolvasome RuvABC endonuclease subunit